MRELTKHIEIGSGRLGVADRAFVLRIEPASRLDPIGLQSHDAKKPQSGSRGGQAASDWGFDALQLRNAFSPASPLDGGL